MHIKKSVLAFAALVALFAAISGVPTAYAAAEQVTHYDVVVHVNTDASVDVDEDINYDFGDANKHGIYRDVPVIYKTKSGANMRLDLQNISVVDGAGQPYQFTTSSNGNDRRIKIGNPNVLITGSHLYVLHYSVPHAVGFFDGFDEIYWNAVGTGWTVPIYNATARVVLPKSFAFADVKSSCYAGAYSFDTPCSTMQPMIQQDENKAPVVDTVVFTQGSLQPAQGLTVAVGFPKGIIDSSTAPSQITNQVLGFWQDGWLWFVVPIIVFILMFRRWYTHGRDPKGTGVIVAQYESPDGLTPMQIGYMADQGFSN